jgi:hypothetical protein
MKLTARLMGFYKGVRIRPGETFEFSGAEAPKWAYPAGAADPNPVKQPVLGDTKPPAAQQAAKAKAGEAAKHVV